MKIATISLLLPLLAGISLPALADGPANDPLTGTNWHLASLGDAPAADGVKSTMTIAEDGMVSGNGGCNGFGGTVTVTGDAVAFSQMRSTMMACEEKAMQQEHALHMALEAAKTYAIDGQTLTLRDGSGTPVATFSSAMN
ncbi:hypothetical protein GCM10011321_03600 [Youhaiella tibetensis]|uniref:META domain-containing protein n=1 Tax=Paradevosia tibetensis TaxID=1447062 RepID=A0A5B9DSM0_9HYPH|nr:META domain-containing protein [Youhaiella tibetensis]QEE21438.1 META domain-containing protein [Youhaiella tibetensis]GGF15037.1 hypothetical protein GCM10011321_03600 [Youhaiella tibetensis]